MTKTKIDNILKGGNKFKLRDLDIDDPEFDEMIQAVEEEKKISRQRKKTKTRRDIYTD